MESELEKIKNRYELRKTDQRVERHNRNTVYSQFIIEEREAKYKLILKKHFENISNLTLLEIGAGTGGNLPFFLNEGIKPINIYANELLDDRLLELQHNFSSINILPGDASEIKPGITFDIVFQSTVFTSILDMNFRKKLAAKLWEMKSNGGIVLWYDFVFNNPSNAHVKGIKRKEISSLFPGHSHIEFMKVTLAPPIGRRIGKLYPIINSFFPFLRSHLIAVIS